MKLKYEKPMLEVEYYELETSIAANCLIVVSSGPEHYAHKACEDYEAVYGAAAYSMNSARYNIDFYDDCDCYYSASGAFFTS